MKNVVVQLIRNPNQSLQTTGLWLATLNEEEIFRCDTLERPWRNNQKGISCYPVGEYWVEKEFMESHNVFHYLVQSIPGRDSCFVHGGNFVTDVHGCTILGRGYSDINKDGLVDILNSRKTVDAFETLLNFERFKLVVVNKLPDAPIV